MFAVVLIYNQELKSSIVAQCNLDLGNFPDAISYARQSLTLNLQSLAGHFILFSSLLRSGDISRGFS